MIFASFLEERNPFINEETAVSATMDVNVDNAKQVGDRILSSMENKSVSEYSFKRKNQTVTRDCRKCSMFVLMTFRASLLLISLNDTSPFKKQA
jgi:hypothetical protein